MHARRISAVLLGLTFLLLLVGGVVHSTGSSLACPDWPLCYGQVFPAMRGGIFYEHSHRLLASAVGLLTLALAFAVWSRPALRRLALLGVALVVVQGTLGGLTVLLRLPPAVSIAHLATSMAFFAWATGMRFRLREAAPAPTLPHRAGVLIAAGAVYVQLVLGAIVRHKGASLSCGLEALTCLGGWLPTTELQWLQTAHRVFALGVTAAVIAGTLEPIKAARLAGRTLARRLGVAAHALVLAQVLMGVLTLRTAVHMHVVTTHLALGALLWADLLAFFWALGPLGGTASTGAAAPAGARPAAV